MINQNSLKLISYNVNGLLHPIKRSKILSKLKKEEIMVAFLQETHLTEKEHEKLKRNGFTQVYSSSYSSGHRRGVAVLISGRIPFQKVKVIGDKEGRYVLVKGKIEGVLVSLLNIYAPPGSDWSFYRKLFDLIAVEGEGILVVGGDLNQRLNPELDSSAQTSSKNLIAKKITDMMREMGIMDVWRELNPNVKDYTFYSTPHNNYSRIDYFLMWNKDRYQVDKCEIGNMDLSDHSPVSLNLLLSPEKRKRTWRINNNLLKGKMREEIKIEIQRYLDENDNEEVSPPILWDACKAVLRGKLIAKAAYLKKQKQITLDNLKSDLLTLEQQHKQNHNNKLPEEIKKKRSEINDIYSEEIQKNIMFTKQKYYEVGSRSTKLLAYKLKKQHAKNSIYGIRDPLNKKLNYKTEDIQKSFESYYKKLYEQPSCNDIEKINSYLEKLELPKVTEEQNNRLIADITAQEINRAISKLKIGKSPGADGFTSEWYKVYRELLIPILQRTFNWVLKKGETPHSWREAIISVIPKEGKDEMECSSYRPISVLNQDYRLFTAIMARRMEGILPDIIQLDQTGFIKERQTQDNIRRTLHVMQHIKDNHCKAIIMGMDAEKAFDSVRWEYLYKVLQKQNFHKTFIQTISALYTQPTARIKINGSLSEAISLKRGCRQGCSASPLLFSIFLEPLSQAIKNNGKILGIDMKSGVQKVALFADDLLIYLSSPDTSLPELMTEFEEFGQISGYKINVHKTQVMAHNYCPSENIKKTYNINWSKKSIKYLGVNLTWDLSQLKTSNYDPLITKIKEDIERWKLIPFTTLATRVEVIKMNVLPRLLFLFQNLPVEIQNKEFIEWDRFISRYIWQGKKPRVKYKTLQLPKRSGGLALPCFRSYYQAAQIKILVNLCNPSYFAKWKEIETESVQGIPVQALIGDDRLRHKYKEHLSPWLETSLKEWFKIVSKYNLTHSGKLLRWIGYDIDFTPNEVDGRFRKTAQSPHMFWEIVENDKCKSFDYIKERWGWRNTDFYMFLQLRHYIHQKITKGYPVTDTCMISLFKLAYQSKLNRKIVCKIYTEIESLKKESSEYVKRKWEVEASIRLSMEEWENIFQRVWKTTFSLTWREHLWKNMIRFFRSPAQTKYRDTSCWRQCGEAMASHVHIFWSCPKIVTFWKELKKYMDKVLQRNLPFSFETFYLGLVEMKIRQNLNNRMFRYMLLAGKKAITRNWLKTEVPGRSTWLDIMHEIYVMEKLTFAIRLDVETCEKVWEGWLKFIKPIRSDFT